jgi:hypothetical protein
MATDTTTWTGTIYTGPFITGTQDVIGSFQIWNPLEATTYYKMCGWYATGSVFEVWVSAGSPSLTPPSAHILSNIFIVTSWTV